MSIRQVMSAAALSVVVIAALASNASHAPESRDAANVARTLRAKVQRLTQHPKGPPQGRPSRIPDVFDTDDPTVKNLQPALLDALRRAATDARAAGVDIVINSGWRSVAHQEELLQRAITTYGSREKAARWVATPEKSAHVAGEAVDVGPAKGASWLEQHGGAYGLCRTYRNEACHFELRPSAVTHGCPAMYADPTQDPRMAG